MDRTAWIAVVLATIGLLASIYWRQQQLAEERIKSLQQQAALAAQATPSASPKPYAATPAQTASLPTARSATVPDQTAVLKSDVSELDFSNNR
jgi:hypothetical protein